MSAGRYDPSDPFGVRAAAADPPTTTQPSPIRPSPTPPPPLPFPAPVGPQAAPTLPAHTPRAHGWLPWTVLAVSGCSTAVLGTGVLLAFNALRLTTGGAGVAGWTGLALAGATGAVAAVVLAVLAVILCRPRVWAVGSLVLAIGLPVATIAICIAIGLEIARQHASQDVTSVEVVSDLVGGFFAG